MFLISRFITPQNLFRLNVLGWILYKLTTLNLWFSVDRNFPLVSPFEGFSLGNSFLQDSLSGLSLLILITLVFKRNKPLLIILLLFESVLIGSDMMRWQPPVFQFFILTLVYTIKPKYFNFYLILFLSATYFYSGLNKFNLRFINFIWAKSILTDFLGVSPSIAYSKWIKAIGFLIPTLECIAGILIMSKYRKIGLYIIIGIHVFVLLYIGPWSLNINSAVWFWNLIMILYAFAFLSQSTIEKRKIKIVEVFWCILIYGLPILNLFQLYYPYFSFDLYSGSRYYLYLNTVSAKNLYLKDLKQEAIYNSNTLTLNIDNWSRQNLNTPFTHSLFLYDQFIKSYSKAYPDSEVYFELSKYPYKTKNRYSE